MMAKNKSPVLKRLLKAGVIVICVTGFLLQTLEFLLLYWTYPTVVDIQVSVPSEIEIPAISVCSHSGIYPLSVCKLGGFCTQSAMLKFMDICEPFPEVCPEGVPPPDFKAVSYDRFFEMKDLNTSALDNLRVPLEDFFKCKIVSGGSERPCNIASAMIGSYYSDESIPNFCFTLYSHWGRPNARVEKIKKSEKIELDFYVDGSFRDKNAPLDELQLPKYNSLSSASIQMAIHSRYMVASPFVSGVGFLGGKKYRVKIKQSEKHLLPPPYQTNCTDYMPAWRARGGIGPLTQLMVIQECKANATLEKLGCIPFFIDYPHNETICKYCSNCPDVKRIGNNCTELLNIYNQPCDIINYDMEVEEKLVDIVRLFESQFLAKAESFIVKEKGYNCTYEKIFTKRCQSLNIEMVFDEFEITNVTYNPKFESLELFSVVGGYMGMYLGVSIVAFYDFAESAIRALYRFMKKRRNSKKTSDIQKKRDPWAQRMEGMQYPKSYRKNGSRYSDSARKRTSRAYSPRYVY